MKLVKEVLNTAGSTPLSSRKLRIRATHKAFKELVKTLYNDPIEAAVRELASNAWDSQVKAGCPERPFDVHLPNALEPEFSIRDYGVGLTCLQIDDVYCELFNSDKSDSDEYIGQKGLGAKSPLAYTDQYQLTSWSVEPDGKRYKHIYACFDTTEGPQLDCLYKEETDEPVGVQVSMPIKEEDYQRFSRQAAQVFRFFTVPPNVDGNPEYKIEPFAYALQAANYGLIREDKSRVIMGQISYDLMDNHGWSRHVPYPASQQCRQLVQAGVHVFAPIGAVQVSTSRDSLSYADEATGKYVAEALMAAVQALTTQAVARVEACSSYREARTLARSLRYDKAKSGGWAIFEHTDFTYQGRKVEFTAPLPKTTQDANGGFTMYQAWKLNIKGETAQGRPRYKLEHISYFDMGVMDSYVMIPPDRTLTRPIDVPGGLRYVEEYGHNHVILLDFDPTPEWLAHEDIAHMLVDRADIPPKPPRAKRDPNAPRSTSTSKWTHMRCFQTGPTLADIYDAAWSNARVDLAQGGIYVLCHGAEALMQAHKTNRYAHKPIRYDARTLARLWCRVRLLLGVSSAMPLTGCIPSFEAKLQKSGQWVRLDDALDAALATRAATLEVRAQQCEGLPAPDVIINRLAQGEPVDGFHKDSPFQVYRQAYLELVTDGMEGGLVEAYTYCYTYRHNAAPATSDRFSGLLEAAQAVYPLVELESEYLPNRYGDSPDDRIRTLLHYIRLVDEANRKQVRRERALRARPLDLAVVP